MCGVCVCVCVFVCDCYVMESRIGYSYRQASWDHLAGYGSQNCPKTDPKLTQSGPKVTPK